MLALHFNRLLFTIGLAAGLGLSAPVAQASTLSASDPCDFPPVPAPAPNPEPAPNPAKCFSILASHPNDYIAGDDSGRGNVTFTFSNNQNFDVQIKDISLSVPYCYEDCSDNKLPGVAGALVSPGGDYVTYPFIDTGTTCGASAFLRKVNPGGDNAQNSCKVQVGFSLRDDRGPDPDTDYGLWKIYAELVVTKAGDPTTPGAGLGDAFIYGVDKGATIPEPSTLFLMLAGALALLLPRVIDSFCAIVKAVKTEPACSPWSNSSVIPPPEEEPSI
jgi:hypothetical protein